MRARALLLSLASIAAATAGCLGTSPDGSASVYLTAEPGSKLREVQLDVSNVHVRPAGSTPQNETDVLQSDRFPENWVEVSQASAEVEMTFDAGDPDKAVFFGEGPVPVEDYDGVGVLVESVTAVDRNGTPVDVDVADAVTDVRTNFSVTETDETRLLLTLDLDESLDPGEREGEGWLFTPLFTDVDAVHVPDDASGDERHAPGEAANLTG